MKPTPSSYKERVIATKVTAEVAQIFEAIADRIGISMYELLGLMIHCVIRYADKSHAVDMKLKKVIDMFEDFEGWDYMTSITTGQRVAVSKAAYIKGKRNFAIYFFRDLRKKKACAVMLDNEKYPKVATYNVVDILQEMIDTCFPKFAKTLQAECKKRDVDTYYEALQDIVAESKDDDEDSRYIDELFSDNDRDVFGKKIEIKQYKPLNRKNPYIERKPRPIAKAVKKVVPMKKADKKMVPSPQGRQLTIDFGNE